MGNAARRRQQLPKRSVGAKRRPIKGEANGEREGLKGVRGKGGREGRRRNEQPPKAGGEHLADKLFPLALFTKLSHYVTKLSHKRLAKSTYPHYTDTVKCYTQSCIVP